MKRNFLGIDIGGTWLKGMLISCDDTCSAQHLATSCRKMTSVRVKSHLMSPEWIIYLKEKTDAPVTLVNDAEAACIGAAGLNYLSGNVCYGIAPIGTGLGFVVLRNGRRWCDSSVQLPLLGSVYAQSGSIGTEQ